MKMFRAIAKNIIFNETKEIYTPIQFSKGKSGFKFTYSLIKGQIFELNYLAL